MRAIKEVFREKYRNVTKENENKRTAENKETGRIKGKQKYRADTHINTMLGMHEAMSL